MTGARNKCEAIAREFYKRMQARSVLEPEQGPFTREDSPLPPFRERETEPHNEVNIVEVRKAIDALTQGKAAGPDSFPPEILKKLHSLEEPLRLLINLILKRL